MANGDYWGSISMPLIRHGDQWGLLGIINPHDRLILINPQ